MKNKLIIISGGMDSVTLLYEHKDEIGMALSFAYGSNHSVRELECADYHCRKLGIPHKVVNLDFMKDFGSALTSGADKIPEGHYAAENMKSTVVPFRNGIMLAVAAGYAEANNLTTLMLASHFGDHAIYPDCRESFSKAISEAIRLGTYAGITVEAPYSKITKDEIAKRGALLGVDYSKTWSCYKGGEKHCGKCGTCVERKEAFALAGLNDPTEYLD